MVGFAFTVFAGAVLLFLVEPLIAKSLLPWFGGSPAVWTSCLMFFQVVMLAGYAYAHLITTVLRPKWQVAVHLLIVSVGLTCARVLPDPAWMPTGREWPTGNLLVILLVHLGPSFFALAATAPLLQAWFARCYSGQSPYPLYAVSNGGSIAAVLAYPLIVEPLWPLHHQELGWFTGFALFFVGSVYCCQRFWRGNEDPEVSPNTHLVSGTTSGNNRWIWFGLSAVGSVLLVATTAQVTENLAAAPLLWVIPLCLYLLSFVLCFAADTAYRRSFWLSLAPIAAVGVALQLGMGHHWPIGVQLTVVMSLLFAGCMVCHGELARLRPAADRLTGYYLLISAGGAAGGAFVALIAPLVFVDLWEYPLGWAGLYTLLLAVQLRERDRSSQFQRLDRILVLLSFGWLIAVGSFVVDVVVDWRNPSLTTRDFYGRLAVSRKNDKQCLFHGRIQHGCQWLDPKRALEPTTYYGPDSGIAVGLGALRDLSGNPLRIGVIGLGAGACAVWGAPGDEMRFYELSPSVVRLARQEFTFLSRARAEVTIEIGDARLALEREASDPSEPRFDLLVLDAFLGDAVPLHLLTREAFVTYWKRVKSSGAVVAHISNRHLDLEPLMYGMSDELGHTALFLYTDEDRTTMTYRSRWVLFSGDSQLINAARARTRSMEKPSFSADPIVFTDQFSNLLAL